MMLGDSAVFWAIQQLCTNKVLYIYALVLLSLALKRFMILVWDIILSASSQSLETYREIENRIFFEQFEDPNQEFKISDFDYYPRLLKQLEENRLYAINQNWLKVNRSDSIDQTLDRINAAGN